MSTAAAGAGHAPLTAPLVAFCSAVRCEALPPEVLHHARRHVIDTLAAIVAGSAEPLTRKVAATVQAWQGEGRWAVPGLTLRAGLLDAAYITGVAAHGTETDDGYRRGSLHPGAVVLPALLGLAASRQASGARLIEAVVAGYQAMGAISAVAHPMLRRRGFHPTAAIGPLGAALAVSRLLGLNAAQACHALGMAASAGAGLFAFKAGGADVKRLHVGHAAREGLLAALHAEQGISGPPAVLEGPDGFLQAFAGLAQPAPLPLPPQVPYTIADCYMKPYACCRHLHPAMDAAMARKFAAIWLLNPMVATISTRGSSEGLLGVLVTALLWAVMARRVTLAGLLLGFGVHFKIYPFIYAPAIVWWMDGENTVGYMTKSRPASRTSLTAFGRIVGFLTPERLRLALVSLATLFGLNALMFKM